jgi:hypothetical protein
LGNGNVSSIAEIDADDREAREIPIAAIKHQLRPATRQGNVSTYVIRAPISAFPMISVQSALG